LQHGSNQSDEGVGTRSRRIERCCRVKMGARGGASLVSDSDVDLPFQSNATSSDSVPDYYDVSQQVLLTGRTNLNVDDAKVESVIARMTASGWTASWKVHYMTWVAEACRWMSMVKESV